MEKSIVWHGFRLQKKNLKLMLHKERCVITKSLYLADIQDKG